MLKAVIQLATLALLFLFLVTNGPTYAPGSAPQGKMEQVKAKVAAGSFTVAGRTECVPGRKALIAPVPLHPVDEVLVAAGARVKKDQTLIKLDDDEPKADVRTKEAAVEAAKITNKEAKRYWDKVQELYKHGAFPEASYFQALTAALKAEQDERGAIAAMESAKYELEHYELKASIDGVISRLDCYVGMVSRPGTTTWGEILDLSEIDVRCMVTLDQVDGVKIDQAVELQQPRKNGSSMSGKVVVVGITVDQATGLVPVIVRVANPDMQLRCGEAVQLTFGGAGKAK